MPHIHLNHSPATSARLKNVLCHSVQRNVVQARQIVKTRIRKKPNPCPCTQILSIIFHFNFRNWFYAGNSRPISHAVQVNFPEYWSVPKQHHCGINFYMSWVEGMRWQVWKVQRRLNHKWNVTSVTYLKCWTVMAFMPVWQLTRRSEVTGFDFTPAESFSWLFSFFIRSQKVVVRDSRLPLALADPPPPHFLCITGPAAHNRWLSLFSSPQSRPGQVLCYLPETKRGRAGKLRADVEFHTPRPRD